MIFHIDDSYKVSYLWKEWRWQNPQYWNKPGYRFVRKSRAKYVISRLSFFGTPSLPYFD